MSFPFPYLFQTTRRETTMVQNTSRLPWKFFTDGQYREATFTSRLPWKIFTDGQHREATLRTGTMARI